MREHSIELSRRKFLTLSAMAGAGIAATGILSNPLQAYGVTAAEKRAEAAATLDKLNALNNKLDIASNDLIEALAEQEAARGRMQEAEENILAANERIATLQDKLGMRVRSMYRSGSSSFIDMLLGATTFAAFTQNWNILNDMNESDAEMVDETKELRVEIEQQKVVYEEQERVATEQAEAAAQVQAEAQALVDEVQATYDSLSAEAQALLEAERTAREEVSNQQGQKEVEELKKAPGNYNNDKVQTVTGNIVVDRAMSQIGKPYSYGAGGPDSYDCSGLVGYAVTGRYGHALGGTGSIIGLTHVSDPVEGDIAVVHNSSRQHTGIYTGGSSMIHAPHTGANVGYGSTSGMVFVRY